MAPPAKDVRKNPKTLTQFFCVPIRSAWLRLTWIDVLFRPALEGPRRNRRLIQIFLDARHYSGFQASSRGGRWSWTLKLAQKRSRAGRWSWAAKVGLLTLRVVSQQQCNGHCPCDSAQHGSSNSNCAMHLTLPLFWRRSTVSPVFFGRYPRSSLNSLSRLLHPPPPPPVPRPRP